MSKHKKVSKKKVSIIIPFYSQYESDLAIPLSSINLQVGVDFSKIDVHLVNDGGTPIDLEKLALFANLDLHYHELSENVGPGLARQYGIDHSEGEYIMFVDADDSFYYEAALESFFRLAEDGSGKNYDLISASYIGQHKNRSKFYYRTYLQTNRGVYSKWFKRTYLKKLGLRFHPELRYFEDTYFTMLAFMFTQNIATAQNSAYIWRHRDDSIFRMEDGYQAKRQDMYVKALRLVTEFLSQHLTDQETIRRYVMNNLAYIYLAQKKRPPVEKDLYQQELQLFLDEFSPTTTYSPALQTVVDLISKRQDSEYQDVDTSGLQEFLKKS